MYKVQFSYETTFDLSTSQDKARSEFERLVQEAAVLNGSTCFHSGFGFGQRDLCYEFQIEDDASAFCHDVNHSEKILEQWSLFMAGDECEFYVSDLEIDDIDEKDLLSEIVQLSKALKWGTFLQLFDHAIDHEDLQCNLIDAWLENMEDILHGGDDSDRYDLVELHREIVLALRNQ